jgi:hypothetical protein
MEPQREMAEMTGMRGNPGCCRKLLMASLIAWVGTDAMAPGAARAEEHPIRIARTDDQLPARQALPPASLGQALLTAIATWLSAHFDLPMAQSHPRVELVPSAKIAALRYRGLIPDARAEIAPRADASPSDRDVVAVYSDTAQTIYLAEDWTGSTASELSTLVHEMVHHLQNVGRLKYECPQAREKLAYMAQDRWLALFGRNLEQDFELDGFSLLVKTRCFH